MKKELSFEERIRLPESLWSLLQDALPKFKRGRPSKQTKNFIEAVYFRYRTGIPWRDLPPNFGYWKTTYNRFIRWCKAGHFLKIFEILKKKTNEPIKLIDSTIVKAHQHAAGARGGQEKQGLGRSAGGFSSKVHLRSDGDGNPEQIFVTGGQEHDINKAVDLTKDLSNNSSVAADKAYDCSDLRIKLLINDIEPLIPSRSNRTYKPPYNKEKYKIRYRIECFFNKLKQYRGFATRYDKLTVSYLSGIAFLCAMICVRSSV